MDLAAELAQFKPEPALAEWVGKLLEKTQKDALKIQALTFELAYYKRIRFANKSEQFSSEHYGRTAAMTWSRGRPFSCLTINPVGTACMHAISWRAGKAI